MMEVTTTTTSSTSSTREEEEDVSAATFYTTRRNLRMDPTRHRFQTKLSLCLTAFFVIVLASLSWYYAPPQSTDDYDGVELQNGNNLLRLLQDNEGVYSTTYTAAAYEDYTNYSCHDLFVETPTAGDDQCAFAKTCNDGEGVWLPFVFCSNKFSIKALSGMVSPLILLWLVIMFRLLGSTAEDYFSPSLEYFSVKAKLPPRFAGVTLLALGNGAADVSATVNAITSDKEHGYQMSLGALTGAAMFVGGVVSAVVVIVAGGVPCRGALVRDVCSLLVTIVVIWVHFAKGYIGAEAISLFLSMYGIFVILVFVADVYHRGVVLPRLALQAQQRERERQMQAAEDVHELVHGTGNVNNSSSMELAQQQQQQPQPNSALGNVLSALSNYDQTVSFGDNPAGANAGWGVDSDELGQDRPVMLHGAAGVIRGTPRMHPPLDGDVAAEQGVGTPYAVLEDAADRICAEPGPSGGAVSHNWAGAWEEGKQELVDHANQVWEDIFYDGDLHVVEKFLLVCELPFTFLRKVCTEKNIYSCCDAREPVSQHSNITFCLDNNLFLFTNIKMSKHNILASHII
jgi:hypothetical protein